MKRNGQSCPSLNSESSFGQPDTPQTIKRNGQSCPSLNSESSFGKLDSPQTIQRNGKSCPSLSSESGLGRPVPSTKRERKDTQRNGSHSSTAQPPFPQNLEYHTSSRANSILNEASALSCVASVQHRSLRTLRGDHRPRSWPLINDQRGTVSSSEQITQKASTSVLSTPRVTVPISEELEDEISPANDDTGPPEANETAAPAYTPREEPSAASIRENTQSLAAQGSTKASVGGNALSLGTLDTIREEPSDAIVENAPLQATSAISAEPSVANAGENVLLQAMSDVTTEKPFFDVNARDNALLPATSDTSTEEPADALAGEDFGMPLVPIPPHGIQNNREVRIQSGQNYKEGFQILLENLRLKRLINCTQCLCSERNIVFLPCGHIALCRGCAHGLAKCSICDLDIRMMITLTSTFSSGGFELE